VKRYILTEPAAEDLEEIIRFIAEDNPDAARLIEALFVAGFEILPAFPDVGTSIPLIGNRRLRSLLVHPSYRIIYDRHVKPIQIIRILHKRQSVKKQLF